MSTAVQMKKTAPVTPNVIFNRVTNTQGQDKTVIDATGLNLIGIKAGQISLRMLLTKNPAAEAALVEVKVTEGDQTSYVVLLGFNLRTMRSRNDLIHHINLIENYLLVHQSGDTVNRVVTFEAAPTQAPNGRFAVKSAIENIDVF